MLGYCHNSIKLYTFDKNLAMHPWLTNTHFFFCFVTFFRTEYRRLLDDHFPPAVKKNIIIQKYWKLDVEITSSNGDTSILRKSQKTSILALTAFILNKEMSNQLTSTNPTNLVNHVIIVIFDIPQLEVV